MILIYNYWFIRTKNNRDCLQERAIFTVFEAQMAHSINGQCLCCDQSMDSAYVVIYMCVVFCPDQSGCCGIFGDLWCRYRETLHITYVYTAMLFTHARPWWLNPVGHWQESMKPTVTHNWNTRKRQSWYNHVHRRAQCNGIYYNKIIRNTAPFQASIVQNEWRCVLPHHQALAIEVRYLSICNLRSSTWALLNTRRVFDSKSSLGRSQYERLSDDSLEVSERLSEDSEDDSERVSSSQLT